MSLEEGYNFELLISKSFLLGSSTLIDFLRNVHDAPKQKVKVGESCGSREYS